MIVPFAPISIKINILFVGTLLCTYKDRAGTINISTLLLGMKGNASGVQSTVSYLHKAYARNRAVTHAFIPYFSLFLSLFFSFFLSVWISFLCLSLLLFFYPSIRLSFIRLSFFYYLFYYYYYVFLSIHVLLCSPFLFFYFFFSLVSIFFSVLPPAGAAVMWRSQDGTSHYSRSYVFSYVGTWQRSAQAGQRGPGSQLCLCLQKRNQNIVKSWLCWKM